MAALLRYDEACRALADAKTFRDVNRLRSQAAMMEAVARIAKNTQLELDAAEIRFRAERRLGEMLSKSLGRGRPKNGSQAEPFPRLAEIGVDKKLSAKAQTYAAWTPDHFEEVVGRWRDKVLFQHEAVPRSLLKLERMAREKAERARAKTKGGKVADLVALAATGWRFGAGLIDPPWHFVTRSEDGEARSASQHYDTRALDAIAALPVGQLAADNSLIGLWMVDWAPDLALQLIDHWGFTHKTTLFTWAKQTASGDGWHMGQGYWTRANPEDCWLATKGRPERLDAGVRQLIVAPLQGTRGEDQHSRKPDEAHQRVERLVAGPYLELYARRPRKGWTVWGDELTWEKPE